MNSLIDDPYEPPNNPELQIDTSKLTPQQGAMRILRYLVEQGFLMLPNSRWQNGANITAAGTNRLIGAPSPRGHRWFTTYTNTRRRRHQHQH